MTAGDPDRNITQAIRMVLRAVKKRAKLILLPELFITGFDYECIASFPQCSTDECLRELRNIAKKSGTVIVAGSVTKREREKGQHPRIFNTCHIIGPDGRRKAKYSKMHLFPLMNEDAHLSPGKSLHVANTAYGKIAPCICFDIRFPELVRRLALTGTEILAVPAEFPYPRLDHWRTLLRGRAIENQFFVIAANRVGEDDTGHFFGHSMIVSPAGEVLAEAGEDEEILMGQIDLNQIDSVRNALPCLDRVNPAVRINESEKSCMGKG
jgi:predicted amidohydrolase